MEFVGYTPAMGFFRGFLAPFRGGLYVLRHPLKRYPAGPIRAQRGPRDRHDVRRAPLLGPGAGVHGPSAPVLGSFFLGIMTVVGGVVLFLIAQPLLLAVFSDQLSERVERDVLGKAETVPFLTSTGRALVHGLLKLVLYGIALVVGLGLTAVTRRPRQPDRHRARRPVARLRRLRLPARPRAPASAPSGRFSRAIPA